MLGAGAVVEAVAVLLLELAQDGQGLLLAHALGELRRRLLGDLARVFRRCPVCGFLCGRGFGLDLDLGLHELAEAAGHAAAELELVLLLDRVLDLALHLEAVGRLEVALLLAVGLALDGEALLGALEPPRLAAPALGAQHVLDMGELAGLVAHDLLAHDLEISDARRHQQADRGRNPRPFGRDQIQSGRAEGRQGRAADPPARHRRRERGLERAQLGAHARGFRRQAGDDLLLRLARRIEGKASQRRARALRQPADRRGVEDEGRAARRAGRRGFLQPREIGAARPEDLLRGISDEREIAAQRGGRRRIAASGRRGRLLLRGRQGHDLAGQHQHRLEQPLGVRAVERFVAGGNAPDEVPQRQQPNVVGQRARGEIGTQFQHQDGAGEPGLQRAEIRPGRELCRRDAEAGLDGAIELPQRQRTGAPQRCAERGELAAQRQRRRIRAEFRRLGEPLDRLEHPRARPRRAAMPQAGYRARSVRPGW